MKGWEMMMMRRVGLMSGLAIGLVCAMIERPNAGIAQEPSSAAEKIPVTAPRLGTPLTLAQADALAALALKNLDREFPHKPGIVWSSAEEIQRPREQFPAFYGSFDWHSSVHGHWMLVRLLKRVPDLTQRTEIRRVLAQHLTRANIEREAETFRTKDNRSFERMYGWAWYWRLVAELAEWDDPQGREWRENLRPLEEVLVAHTRDYLPRLTYPIRTGEHPDTAFALGQLWDYARVTGQAELSDLVAARARDFYSRDRDYPHRYEPSGHDFFSPGWNEADLMRRVLPADEFADWLRGFVPGLTRGELSDTWLRPVEVSDVTDGKLVHLAGLDFSRAWCQNGVAGALPEGSPERLLLQQASQAHGDVGWSYVFSGHYEGEHWLATFAVYWLTEVGR
jgi:hypothetical protein